MNGKAHNVAFAEDGVRERHTIETASTKESQESPQRPEPETKVKKTIGRTPDGTVFSVPQTHDMVSQLLSPKQAKNLSDLVVLVVLGMHIMTLYLLPPTLRISVFAVVFLFWRTCYNGGIGYLLSIQSHHRRLVTWARKSKLFEDPAKGPNPHPTLYRLIKSEMETKIPSDYKFEDAPIEYNTWLVFRRVVDLILMCDFVSYVLFAIACASRPPQEGAMMAITRWSAGLALFGFNLWVKLDAHRVVKDFAWYWGDFFFLVDQELTFDGVFEMAPHPMYSVGYAGYYGISLMAASYNVLFISIIAHAAQFAFLIYIENPHIEKTYNPPPPRKRRGTSVSECESSVADEHSTSLPESDTLPPPLATFSMPSPVHNLMGLQNIDLFRVTDTSVLLLQLYLLALALLSPNTPTIRAAFVLNAGLWRLWYSVGLGFVLQRQSTLKTWTRHFVKFGESTGESWRQWKGLYHLSMTMCYASFIAACWKLYSLPSDWNTGLVLLKHVVGIALIALQIWTAVSIYESLGEFGWFFGDFFFDRASKLTYSGIYRYLNTPERVIGLAGLWGAVLITSNGAIFGLALLSHLLTLAFIHLVERPHMKKLYGRDLRRDSGLVKSLKRSLPPGFRKLQGSVDRAFGDTVEFVEEFIEASRPKIAAGVRFLLQDTTNLFSQYPARLSLTLLPPDLAGLDPRGYSLEIEGSPSRVLESNDSNNSRQGTAKSLPQRTDSFKALIFEYGAPIKVKWTAPLDHGKRDWIGLYRVADNASREVTHIASNNRWTATNEGVYDTIVADKGILVNETRVEDDARVDGEVKDYCRGEVLFEGDKLWWTQGAFEFRYHHNGKHTVMAISHPFEVRIAKFDEDDVEVDANGLVRGAVENALLPMVRNCLDRNDEIAPSSIDELYGSMVERDEKYARRIVYAVQHMFGIEFAPEVVQADGNVKNLAWRICNAKKVLAPYSMSSSKGTTTPTTPKY